MMTVLMTLILVGCGHNRIDTTESTKLLILTCDKLRADIARQAEDEFNSGMCKAHVEIGKNYMLLCQRLDIIKGSLP